jgi:hypothetical protein
VTNGQIRFYTKYMIKPKSVAVLASVALLSFTLSSCGTSSASDPVSVNAATWSTAEVNDFKNGCVDAEGSSSQAICDCLVKTVTNTYTKSEWDIAVAEMNKTGIATKVYMDSWTNCTDKFGTVGNSSPGVAEEREQQQISYPTCIQVLARGNSGLSLADNDTELGRPDGQPGYCILPNSGGEKYYYQGR